MKQVYSTNQVTTLLPLITAEFINDFDHRGLKFTNDYSMTVKKLLTHKQDIIPLIGNYLKNDITYPSSTKDKQRLKDTWRSLIVHIINHFGINMTTVVVNFEDWVDWSINFK